MKTPIRFFILLSVAFTHRPILCQETQDTLPITVIVEIVDGSTAQTLKNVVVRIRDLNIQTLSDSLGRFRLVNVRPGTYRMTLTRQGYLPEEGEFSVMRAGEFQIRLSPNAVGKDASPGRILGRILARESGDMLEGATVTIVGTALRRETNSKGLFEFAEVPAGQHRLRVEYLGREDLEHSVFVPENELLDVEILISIDPIPLEGIVVTAHSKWLATSGFFRRRSASGYDGRQWDRGQLEALSPEILRDALETVSGINQAGTRGYRSRGRCRLTVFVDSFRMDESYDLDQIRPEQVDAMEIYRGNASTMPIEYAMYCGVILIWLKH